MSDSVYVAYQCDVSEYQSLHIRDERDDIDTAEIAIFAVDVARACMFGWWHRISCDLNEALEDAGEASVDLLAHHACFVVRITESQWQIFEVKFSSEDLREAVVVSHPNDGEGLPVSWPLFLERYLKNE